MDYISDWSYYSASGLRIRGNCSAPRLCLRLLRGDVPRNGLLGDVLRNHHAEAYAAAAAKCVEWDIRMRLAVRTLPHPHSVAAIIRSIKT